MKFVLYTNSISAHQLPLARLIASKVGESNFRYVFTGQLQGGGQEIAATDPWIVAEDAAAREMVRECDILLSGNRALDIFEERSARRKLTFYMSERWFKPIPVLHNVWLPGCLRMCVPGYLRQARRFAALFSSDRFRYLPIGPWAARDMVRLCRRAGRPCREQNFIPWGYFVAPSASNMLRDHWVSADNQIGANRQSKGKAESHVPIRLLWVGRMLDWKRVDTILKALKVLCDYSRESPKGTDHVPEFKSPISLTLVGDGPERSRLETLAKGLPVRFLSPQPLNAIRNIMREHDVYILSSNGVEGWGAALSEALTEGLLTLGTVEAGASAALLPQSAQFAAGDWRGLSSILRSLLQGKVFPTGIPFDYTPVGAVTRLFHEIDEIMAQ